MALQSNIYQTQAHIQYGYARRAADAGKMADAAAYTAKGDYYEKMARQARQLEAAAAEAAAPQTRAEREATSMLPGSGPTATPMLSTTDVQTVNSAISTQSAVADAERAVNSGQTAVSSSTMLAATATSSGPTPDLREMIAAQNGDGMPTIPDESGNVPTTDYAGGIPLDEAPKGVSPMLVGAGIVGAALLLRMVMK